MDINFNNIIDSYIKWIKDNTSIKTINDGKYSEIITPFLDRHNDHIQIYIFKVSDKFILTDDGYTIKDLEFSGLDINTSKKREQILKTTLNGFGVKLGEENNELFVECNMSNIGQRKHSLIQAILAVNDMYTLSTENVFSLFKEDVELYLKSNDIFFTKDIKITGKTGFDHTIDFVVSASKSKPERLIKAINRPTKDSITGSIFAFNDIQAIRDQETSNYIIFNDLEKPISSESISALENYKVNYIPWTEKERAIQEFAFA